MTSDDRPGSRRRPWSARAGTGPAGSAGVPGEPRSGRAPDPTTPAQPAGGASAAARGARPRGFGRALAFTVLGAALPGAGFLAAGRRRIGGVVLALFLLLAAGGGYLAVAGQRGVLLRVAVDSSALLWLAGGVALAALAWVAVVVASYRSLLPRRIRGWQQALGGVLVVALCAAVVAPAVLVVQLAAAQRDLVDTVFADRESATVVEPEDPADPFAGRESINVLLLGGDGGEGREGVRTDTVIVANVQTDTGRTTLFSLPRNLQELPFPADSPLAEVYPDGFDAGSESESLLNAVYRNGPAWYPDVLGPTTDPGADFLKLGVGEALGLHIDYYVLVNLEGFSRLIDALGGITVNVNYYVPIGGEPTIGILPDDYIAPGPDQHLDGTRALDFARGRFGQSDYMRMDRQRCVIDAIVAAADPMTLLSQYRELAATTQDIVSTDIPARVLGDVAELALRVKDAEIRSVVFDDTVIDPAYPDYDRIRALVQEALVPAPPVDDAGPAPEQPAPPPDAGVVSEVGDACAYDPVEAAAALAEGEPPTRGG
ncbi:LCP family protein [Modestobacter lapidis]|nr:LCP family protein [Modestobacter lapidis]